MLDDLYNEYDIGTEGLFGPKSVEKLLNNATKQVNKKCKTIEDCDAMLQQVQNEADKFTQNMEQMQQLAIAYKAGNLTKKEFSEQIKAISAQLKDTCMFIGISDVAKSSKNVTDGELANLRAYIIGLTNAIRSRREVLMSVGADDSTKHVNNVVESAFGRAVMTEDGDYEVVEEGIFSRFTKSGKDAKAEVDAMSDEQVLGLYAEYLKKTYGRDLVSDEDIVKNSDETEIVTVSGVKFAKSADGKYSYVLSKGRGKGTKRRIISTKNMRSKVTDEVRKAKKSGAQAEAAEAMVQLMLDSGLAETEEIAVEAVVAALEAVYTDPGAEGYWGLFKQGNKYYNNGCAMIQKQAYGQAVGWFNKAKASYEDCLEAYKNSSDYQKDERNRKNQDTIKGDVKVNPSGGIINLIRNAIKGTPSKEYVYKPKDNIPDNELVEYARALISSCNVAIKRCEQLEASGRDKADWKASKKEARREAQALKKANKDYRKANKNRNPFAPADDTASESFIDNMMNNLDDEYASNPVLEAFLHGMGMCTAEEELLGIDYPDDDDYEEYEEYDD